MQDHKDRVALITGGAQGLGLAVAEQLLAEGCGRLALVGRSREKGAAAVAALQARGAEVVFLRADLADVAQAPSSASKAALANVTQTAAQALRAHRIRVNGINCGWMDTPGEDETPRKYHGAEDGWLEAAEAAQPMGMLVKPAHVAGLVSYMLSPASGVMTGALVDFDQNVAGAYPRVGAR
jgi:NAD(P)-dependent dehydrogenase (short-subunit alcohol dehydrogenase family)